MGGEDGDGDAVGVEAVGGDDGAFEADALPGADGGGMVTDEGDVAEGAVLIDPEVAPGGIDEGGDELDGEGVLVLALGVVEAPDLAGLGDGAEGLVGGRVEGGRGDEGEQDKGEPCRDRRSGGTGRMLGGRAEWHGLRGACRCA